MAKKRKEESANIIDLPEDSPEGSSDRLTSRLPIAWLLAVLFVVLGFLMYSQVILKGPFIFDDYEYITGNAAIKDFSYFSNINNINDPRSVGYLSFALNYALDGENPFYYHVVNVFIHILNALLVFFVIKIILDLLAPNSGRSERHSVTAFLISLVFLTHPVETQAVSYITQRFTSLSAFFYLLSVYLYLQARVRLDKDHTMHGSGYLRYALSLVCAILAMKTKEISFTIPFIITMLEFALFNGSQYGKRRFVFLIPYAAALVIIPISIFGPEWGLFSPGFGVDEITRVDKIYDLYQRSAYEYLVTQFRVIVTYIRLLLIPVHQLAVYDFVASHSLFEIQVILSLIFLLCLAGLAAYFWIKGERSDGEDRADYKIISLGIVWFFVTLSIESSVIPIKDIIFEHRIYLPSVGFLTSAIVLILRLMRKVWDHGNEMKYATTLVVLLVVPLSVGTFLRNDVWTDEVKFWGDIVEKTGKAIGYNNRGNAYAKAGKPELALQDLNKTISFFPRANDWMAWENADFTPSNMSKTYMSRGQVYIQLGDVARAQADFDMSRKIMMLPPGLAPATRGMPPAAPTGPAQ